MDFTAVDDYLHKLDYTEPYTSLEIEDREKKAFTANEALLRRFDEEIITDKTVALQTIYMIEGEDEEFAKFKRHGVKSMGLSGMSFTFDGSNISPEVIELIEKEQSKSKQRGSAAIGRLV